MEKVNYTVEQIIIQLIHSGILKISGKRGADHMLKKETVCICFNPVLSPFLQ